MSPRALAILAVVVVASPAPARAQDTAEANRHFQLGVELYNEGKYSEALVEFERAYQIAPHPLVLYNLAGTHRELSQYDEAIQHYQRFLQEGQGVVKPELLDKGKRELAELEARIGRVTVSVDKDGAQVSVDGRVVGTSPLPRPLVLPPGRHTIVVALPGGPPESREVTVASGDQESLAIEVKEKPPEPIDEPVYILPVEPGPVRYGLSVSAATNALEVADVGTATVGMSLRLGSRFSLGVEVVTVAWAVMPSLRFRLFGGESFSLHALAAVPIAFVDDEESEVFVAGAAGLGLRVHATRNLAFRLEGLVSLAGGDHGTTVPAFAGVELWF